MMALNCRSKTWGHKGNKMESKNPSTKVVKSLTQGEKEQRVQVNDKIWDVCPHRQDVNLSPSLEKLAGCWAMFDHAGWKHIKEQRPHSWLWLYWSRNSEGEGHPLALRNIQTEERLHSPQGKVYIWCYIRETISKVKDALDGYWEMEAVGEGKELHQRIHLPTWPVTFCIVSLIQMHSIQLDMWKTSDVQDKTNLCQSWV